MAKVKYVDLVQDKYGNVLSGVSVTVKNQDGTTASIYSDSAGTVKANPFTTDSNGESVFWADPAAYTLTVSGTDYPATPSTVGDQNGSSLIGWISSAASAVALTLADWLGWRACSPLDFMSSAQRSDVTGGTLALDHTAAVQAAINTGKTVDLLGYTYNVNNLTQSTSFQAIVSTAGPAKLIKNANGPILTSSGSDVEFRSVGFRGESSTPAFTGDNLVSTGDNLRLINCGSRWAYGRGVKASGNHVQIIGTCDLYQTADATATGFDIEVGVSGTSTLYHHIQSIKSSQRTGGIKFVDCGSQTLIGCQIGKVYIAAGTKPAGVNGGQTLGNRILGDITVEQSSAVLSSNQIDAVNVSFALGTSSCTLDESNVFASGSTVTNNGNPNNYIARNVSTGSGFKTRWGADTSYRELTINNTDATVAYQFDGAVVVPNNSAFKLYDSGGTAQSAIALSASNNWTFGANNSTSQTVVNSGSGGVYHTVGGTTIAQTYSGGIRPQTDNSFASGTSTQRWSTVFSYYTNTKAQTVASLTAAATAGSGAKAFVSDSTVAGSGNFGAVVAGGGTNGVPVYSDGTNWRIG